jgi:hypothetical protein
MWTFLFVKATRIQEVVSAEIQSKAFCMACMLIGWKEHPNSNSSTE